MPISVVIATKNRRRFIEFVTKQLSVQVEPDDELVLVDDGSDPIDAAYFKTLVIPCRFTLVRNDQGHGRLQAKNDGILAASHPIILQLDSDAWLVERDSLRIIESLFDSRQTLGVLAIPMHYHNDSMPDECGSLAKRWSFAEMQIESTYIGCAVGIRRDAAIRSGLYPSYYTYGPEEEALAARLFKIGYEVRGTRRIRCIHGHCVLSQDREYAITRESDPRVDVASNQLCLAHESLSFPIRPAYKAWVVCKTVLKGLDLNAVRVEYQRKLPFTKPLTYQLSFLKSIAWLVRRIYVYSANAINRRRLGRSFTLKP